MKRKQLMNSLTPDHGVRGTAHEYWIERRRARLQARKRARVGGPYRAQGTSQEKKENKILDPWA